jgi:hypothetical protein
MSRSLYYLISNSITIHVHIMRSATESFLPGSSVILRLFVSRGTKPKATLMIFLNTSGECLLATKQVYIINII